MSEPSDAAWARFGALAVLAEDRLRQRLDEAPAAEEHELPIAA